jgi:hypothetical protein
MNVDKDTGTDTDTVTDADTDIGQGMGVDMDNFQCLFPWFSTNNFQHLFLDRKICV